MTETANATVKHELSRLRKRRSANRNVIKGWIIKVKDILSNDENVESVKKGSCSIENDRGKRKRTYLN